MSKTILVSRSNVICGIVTCPNFCVIFFHERRLALHMGYYSTVVWRDTKESRENKMVAREARFTLPGFLSACSVRVMHDGLRERGTTHNLTKL